MQFNSIDVLEYLLMILVTIVVLFTYLPRYLSFRSILLRIPSMLHRKLFSQQRFFHPKMENLNDRYFFEKLILLARTTTTATATTAATATTTRHETNTWEGLPEKE